MNQKLFLSPGRFTADFAAKQAKKRARTVLYRQPARKRRRLELKKRRKFRQASSTILEGKMVQWFRRRCSHL